MLPKRFYMAIIVTGDGHANLEALTAVLSEVERRNTLTKEWTEYLHPTCLEVIRKQGKAPTRERIEHIIGKIILLASADGQKLFNQASTLFLRSEAQPEPIEAMYSVGDITGYGPDAAAVIDKHIELQETGFLRGVTTSNHDTYFMDMATELEIRHLSEPDEQFYKDFTAKHKIKEDTAKGTWHSVIQSLEGYNPSEFNAIDAECDLMLNIIQQQYKQGLEGMFSKLIRIDPQYSHRKGQVKIDRETAKSILYDHAERIKTTGASALSRDKILRIKQSNIHQPYKRWRFLKNAKPVIIADGIAYTHTDPTDTNQENWRYMLSLATIKDKASRWNRIYKRNPDAFKDIETCLREINQNKILQDMYENVRIIGCGHVHNGDTVDGIKRTMFTVWSMGQPRGDEHQAGFAIVYNNRNIEHALVQADFNTTAKKMQQYGLPDKFHFVQ